MRFENIEYSENKDPFLVYSDLDIQRLAKKTIRRKLDLEEMKLLKTKTITAIESLMIKINSSGI